MDPKDTNGERSNSAQSVQPPSRAQTSVVWQLLRALKRRGQRILHPPRRRSAVTRLEQYRTPPSILVVCLGNIIRSPYAAAVLRKYLDRFLGQAPQIQSAGFMGAGRPAPDEAIQAAHIRDFDLSAHRSQLITAELVREADLIIVMDQHQTRAIRTRFPIGRRRICVLGDFDPDPILHRRIEDPIEQSMEAYRRTYERIDRCIDQLVRSITRQIAGSR